MRVAERQWRILLAFRPPCLWALYKKTKHFIQEKTQEKQTSKQINTKKKEVKMKTAKNTATQYCPEKPTPSQTSPPSRLSQLLSIFTSHTLPHTTFPSCLTLLLQTRAHVPARTQARNQPLNHSHTNLCCGHFSHGAAGRCPGGTRLAPFTVPSPAFPPASPSAHTPFCQNYPT